MAANEKCPEREGCDCCGGRGKVTVDCDECRGTGQEHERCPDYEGRGYEYGPCRTCDGTGRIPPPAGSDTGDGKQVEAALSATAVTTGASPAPVVETDESLAARAKSLADKYERAAAMSEDEVVVRMYQSKAEALGHLLDSVADQQDLTDSGEVESPVAVPVSQVEAALRNLLAAVERYFPRSDGPMWVQMRHARAALAAGTGQEDDARIEKAHPEWLRVEEPAAASTDGQVSVDRENLDRVLGFRASLDQETPE